MTQRESFSDLPPLLWQRLETVCDRFESEWRQGSRPQLETYLDESDDPQRSLLFRELLHVEIEYRRKLDDEPTVEEYIVRLPDQANIAREVFATANTVNVSLIDSTLDGKQRTQLDSASATQVGHITAGSLFGDYEIIEAIAEGGMGVVYKARQTKLNRLVALKMIRSGELANEEQIERFYSEAQAAAKLDHPGIVPVYEVGQQNGQHFFSMAFVEGVSLHDKVKNDGSLPPKRAAELMKAIAEAVQFGHDKGVVHRDIKPHNILLDESGSPRVTDFGLAKHGDSEMTVAGQVMGTPSYMPPEQAEGKQDEIGEVSDVYSLGATLYYLLTGRPPFQAATPTDTLRQVVNDEPVTPRNLNSEVSRDLETICLKCLEKSPERRYQTSADLAADLNRWLSGHAIQARPVSRAEHVWRWCRRNVAVAGLSVAVVLSLVASICFMVMAIYSADESRQTAKSLAQEKGVVAQLLVQEKKNVENEKLEAERQRALKEENADLLEISRRRTINAQLARVSPLWQERPGYAARMLEDRDMCPVELRDFTWGFLYRLVRQDRMALRGHDHSIQAFAVFPDGKRAASGDAGGVIQLWDLRFGRNLTTINDHVGPITAIACSPDGKWMASADVNRTVRLWQVEPLEEVAQYREDAGSVTCLAFSPDSLELAIGAHGKTITLWDVARSAKRQRWDAHSSQVNAVTYSPGGDVITAGRDGQVSVWSTIGELRHTFTHSHPVSDVRVSEDGELLVAADTDGEIKVWDFETRKLKRTLKGHTKAVMCLAFVGPSILASGALDESVILWDLETGLIKETLHGHTGGINEIGVGLQGAAVVSASHDETVRIWDVGPTAPNREASRMLNGATHRIHSLAISPDGKWVATGGGVFSEKGIVELILWDLTAEKMAHRLIGHTDLVAGMSFSPDSQFLMTASRDKTVRRWSVESGDLQHTITHTAPITSVVCSSDGRTLAAASGGGGITVGVPFDPRTRLQAELRILSTSDGHEVANLRSDFPSTVRLLAYSPDGGILTSSGPQGSLLLWNAKTHTPQAQLGHAKPIFCVGFAPDGRHLATAGFDSIVRIWDYRTKTLIHSLDTTSPAVDSVAFSPDGKTLASGNRDGTIRFWDPVTGQFRAKLEAHTDSLRAMVFSHDSRLLISAGMSDDKPELKIWEATLPSARETE